MALNSWSNFITWSHDKPDTQYLYYKVRCVFVCQHYNVRTLTSPPVLKLWDSQGYLWLPYDLMEVINLIGKKRYFFKKIPSTLVSFLQYYCHSFRILSFLPDLCHSFRIFVIPSRFVSFLSNLVIPFEFGHSFQINTISNICHPE